MTKSVVIVEDDPCWCEALKTFFDGNGEFSALAFTDAHQAWDAIVHSPPDLAVLDVVMPVLGGQELAEMIREKGLSTRVIFLTGLLTLEETKARGYRVGGQTVVGKPAPLHVLLDLARQALAV
ncbi:MAG: response regulator [Desulfovibrio sp.]|nr:response regulator [Desulfovibrio sp.]